MRTLVQRWLGNRLDQRGLYVLARLHGASIGDLVTATAFMRAVHGATGRRFIVVTKYPQIFEHNPLVVRNIAAGQLGFLSKPLAKWLLRTSAHPSIGIFGYQPPPSFSREDVARDHQRRISETEFCSESLVRQWQVEIDFAGALPEIHFSADERARYEAKFAALGVREPFAIVKPIGRVAFTPNKEWGFERYQAVVDQIRDICWIQPGDPGERALAGAVDLNGRADLRELFYLISRARFVLGGEGLINHVAAAFGTPSVVVFSGFSHVELARYPATVPVVRTPQVACAPCWKEEPCPVPGKPCTSDIVPAQVLEAVRSIWPQTTRETELAS